MKICNYVIENTEPISITDLYNSKSDEAAVLSYINGSSVRGALMNRAADQGKLEGNLKKAFFDGTISFRNAYPRLQAEIADNTSAVKKVKIYDTLPVTKGFFEDRDQNGTIIHSFAGEHDGSRKRAKVGQYAVLDPETDGILYYMKPIMGENFRTRLIRNSTFTDEKGNKKQQLFRGTCLEKGQVFKGSIVFSDTCPVEIINYLQELLTMPGLKIGSMRGSGYGRVNVSLLVEDEEQYAISKIKPEKIIIEKSGTYYLDMFCVSNLCMTNDWGEPCGINEDALAKALEADPHRKDSSKEKTVKVIKSAASITHVCSFNRILGGRSAEFPVFEAGSIFRLELSYLPKPESLKNLEINGIGLKREEGFGQILFIPPIENLFHHKEKCNAYEIKQNPEIELAENVIYKTDIRTMQKVCAQSILRRKMETASTNYVIQNPLRDTLENSSQRGMIVTLCKSLRYDTKQAEKKFAEYFSHSELKDAKTAKYRENYKPRKQMFREVQDILKSDLAELLSLNQNTILGYSMKELLTDEDIIRYKLDLIIELMRYTNRSGREV